MDRSKYTTLCTYSTWIHTSRIQGIYHFQILKYIENIEDYKYIEFFKGGIGLLERNKVILTQEELEDKRKLVSKDRETKCNLCDKEFVMGKGLSEHLTKMHNFPQNLQCNQCGKKGWLDNSQHKRHLKKCIKNFLQKDVDSEYVLARSQLK